MTIYFETDEALVHHGDVRAVLAALPDQSVQCIVTSPPYWGLRDYGVEGQIGLEATPEEFIATMVGVFREARRVLRNDGVAWVNMGDSYGRDPAKGQHKPGDSGKQGYIYDRGNGRASAAGFGKGIKPKDLVGVPWMLAFALRADGWYLRQDIIWHKPNPMPESVTDRCTKAHEYIFLLSKSERYHYDAEAIKEQVTGKPPGNTKPTKGGAAYEDGAGEHRTHANLHHIGASETRNKRSVWTVTSEPFSGAHFAAFPTKLIEPCILAGARPGDVVLDPFHGAGTTGVVALRNGRRYLGIELSADYIDLSIPRLVEAGSQRRLFA